MFADNVHFVHIYIIEPHPKSPDLSPYSASVSEGSFSTKNQPATYESRVDHAANMAVYLDNTQLQLIDEMYPLQRNNPMWCTYGPAPNSGYLISMTGKVILSQKWLNIAVMEDTINELLEGIH